MTALHHINEAAILYNLGERSKLKDQRPYTFMVRILVKPMLDESTRNVCTTSRVSTLRTAGRMNGICLKTRRKAVNGSRKS